MKNKKVTLTLGQLRKLVRESIKDLGPTPKRSDFEEPETDDDKNATANAMARAEELKEEIKKYLADNGVVPFRAGRDNIFVLHLKTPGCWQVSVFDVHINFYDNGRIRWDGGKSLDGFDLDDEGDEDNDSIANKAQFRFIQKMINDKEFVKNLKELVLRVGNETEEINNDLDQRERNRTWARDKKYDAAQSERGEKIRKEVRSAKFALIDANGWDESGLLYRNSQCKIIEVGDSKGELQDIIDNPWNHKEYGLNAGYSRGRSYRIVPVSSLKDL